MGKDQTNTLPQALTEMSGAAVATRNLYQSIVLRTCAFAVSAAVMFLFAIAPVDRDPAQADTARQRSASSPVQELAVADEHAAAVVVREDYKVVKPAPIAAAVAARTAPGAGTPDPGTAKAIALEMVTARGWGQSEYDCLVALWNRESHWNVYAHNASSGAYGIPQALPGSKMGSVGADWATNPATQITWGLGYISGRYGTPCGAWNASLAKGWY